jgi:hypothetical protein
MTTPRHHSENRVRYRPIPRDLASLIAAAGFREPPRAIGAASCGSPDGVACDARATLR